MSIRLRVTVLVMLRVVFVGQNYEKTKNQVTFFLVWFSTIIVKGVRAVSRCTIPNTACHCTTDKRPLSGIVEHVCDKLNKGLKLLYKVPYSFKYVGIINIKLLLICNHVFNS